MLSLVGKDKVKRGYLFLLLVFAIFMTTDAFSASVSQYTYPVPIGAVAPDFTVTEVFENINISLSDYLGKVILLDFFATWCGPCVAAMPYMDRIYHSYYPNEFVLISVGVDSGESRELVQSFAKEHNMTWIVARDVSGEGWSNYGTGYIPTMYIINQTGYIHYQEVGFDNQRVLNSLDGLISRDTTAPQMEEVTLNVNTLSLSIYDNEIKFYCQNISDDLFVEAVLAQIKGHDKNEVVQYELKLLPNGTLNYNLEIDPKQLYQESRISIWLTVSDYQNNTISTEVLQEIAVDDVGEDESDPRITSITVEYIYNATEGYYYFDAEAEVSDDLLIYSAAFKLREGSMPNSFTLSYSFGDNYYEEAGFVWPNSDHTIFHAKFKISDKQISNPEIVNVEVTITDIAGNQRKALSTDDFNASVNFFSDGISYILTISFAFFFLGLSKKRY